MKKLVIVGAGGLGIEALWVVREMGMWDCAGFADDDASRGEKVDGIPLLGRIDAALARVEPCWFHCAIGNNAVRKAIFGKFQERGWKPATLVHPSVILGPDSAVGEGSYVGAGSILCPHSVVGGGVVINCHVTVGHHASMGDFSQACPGVRVSGFCKVGELGFLGSNASMAPGVSVGVASRVGANSFVVANVKDGRTVIGVPARS